MKTDKFLNINSREGLERAGTEVQNRFKALESKKIIAKNKLNKLRKEIITRLFATMKEMGVDPADINAVGSFMRELEAEDPDLFNLFETAMNGILGDEETESASINGNEGMMGKFRNLQENILRK